MFAPSTVQSGRLLTRVCQYVPSSRAEWGKYLAVLLPVILSSIVSQATVLMGIFLAGSLGTADTNEAALNGLYQYSTFALLYNAVFGAVLTIMSPVVAQNIKTASPKTTRVMLGTIMQMQLVVFALLTLFNAFLAPLIAAQLTNAAAVGYFRTYSSIALCVMFFQSLYNPQVVAYIARGRTEVAVIATLLEVLCSVVFNLIFLFAIRQSITLLAIASVTGSACVCLAVNGYVFATNRQQLTHPFCHQRKDAIPLGADRRIYTASLYKYMVMKAPALLFSFIWAWEAVAKNLTWAFGDAWNGGAIQSSFALSTYYGLTWVCLCFYSAVTQLVPYFVGRPLGEKNYQAAIDNARKLIGLAAIVGALSILLLVTVALTAPNTAAVDVSQPYREVGRNVMLVNALTAVFWLHQGLFITIMLAGGKNVFMSLVILLLGIVQIGWQWAIVLLHRYEGLFDDFAVAFLLTAAFEPFASLAYFALYRRRSWVSRIALAG